MLCTWCCSKLWFFISGRHGKHEFGSTFFYMCKFRFFFWNCSPNRIVKYGVSTQFWQISWLIIYFNKYDQRYQNGGLMLSIIWTHKKFQNQKLPILIFWTILNHSDHCARPSWELKKYAQQTDADQSDSQYCWQQALIQNNLWFVEKKMNFVFKTNAFMIFLVSVKSCWYKPRYKWYI